MHGTLVGGVQLPQAAVSAVCDGADCGPSVVPASGTTTFSVPVIGDTPQIQLDASWQTTKGGKLHYYSGSLVIDACTRKQTATADSPTLLLDHSELSGLGDSSPRSARP